MLSYYYHLFSNNKNQKTGQRLSSSGWPSVCLAGCVVVVFVVADSPPSLVDAPPRWGARKKLIYERCFGGAEPMLESSRARSRVDGRASPTFLLQLTNASDSKQ